MKTASLWPHGGTPLLSLRVLIFSIVLVGSFSTAHSKSDQELSTRPLHKFPTGYDPAAGLQAAVPRGLLIAQQEAQLSSLMDGQIRQIHKREGERFAKKEILVSFFCPIQRARVQQARAALDAGRKRLQVKRELIAIRAATRLDVELMAAEVRQKEAELAIQQAMLDRCRIHAPFAGRISHVHIHAHESVKPGTPLLDIATEGRYEIKVMVPSRYYAKLKIGSPFAIHLQETNRSYPVHIIRMAGRIDPVSQTIAIVGQISGTFPELIPGMGGAVTFPKAGQ